MDPDHDGSGRMDTNYANIAIIEDSFAGSTSSLAASAIQADIVETTGFGIAMFPEISIGLSARKML